MYLGELKLDNQRRPKEPKRAWLNSFKDKPCEVCGSTGNVVAAHIRLLHFGRGIKPADWQVLALCDAHHKEQEHGGWEWLLRNILFPILQRRYLRWESNR